MKVFYGIGLAILAVVFLSGLKHGIARVIDNNTEVCINMDNDLEEVLTTLEKQSWEAWKNRDGKFFEGFLSDDHVELSFGGPMNKATVVRSVSSPMCEVKSYEVNHFKLFLFDSNTAVLTYHAAQDTTCGGIPVPSPVWVSSLYLKRNGRWVNALYQQSQTKK